MIVKHADDVAAEDVRAEGAAGVRIRLLIHDADGAPHFYMRQFTVAPGGHTPRHSHPWEHEVYVVAGAGVAVAPDGDHPIGVGDCVFVPPDTLHQFRSTGGEELKILCLVPKTDA